MARIIEDKTHPTNPRIIRGPYQRKDGRFHVIMYDGEGYRKKTVSYPKFIYECHHKVILDRNETIDHIDRDSNNNDISNLQCLSRSEHIKLDAIRRVPVYRDCPICRKNFKLTKDQQSPARRKEKAGPFCSKSCAGKYTSSVQWGAKKIAPKPLHAQYYMLDKG